MMDTDFVDEAGHQIPVEFSSKSVMSVLFKPFRAVRRTVRG
ncbi:MAG: hypothetical protein ABEJ64_04490 [Candidatus Nanohaloarchaea archaeon]